MQQGSITLATLDEVPHLRPINLGAAPSTVVAINCKKYRSSAGLKQPETEALDFYAMNHLVAVLKAKFTKNEPLPTWAREMVAEYIKVLCEQGMRMTYYMALITTRESRHVGYKGGMEPEFTKKFGTSAYLFNQSIQNLSSQPAADQFCNDAPKMPIGLYLDSLVYLFTEGSFSGGFGGKPWAMIAQTLASFLNGATSLEVMLDTAYTLAHNNGPMFNKGMLFAMYSNELYKILDVQRAGQIPELILDASTGHKASPAVAANVKFMKQTFPNEFGDYVDWQQVEDLGALHGPYTAEKKAQVNYKPKPLVTKEGYPITGDFHVMPGHTAKVFKRQKVSA